MKTELRNKEDQRKKKRENRSIRVQGITGVSKETYDYNDRRKEDIFYGSLLVRINDLH